MKCNIGRFEIYGEIIKTNIELAKEILEGVVVLKAESLFHKDSIEYIGISDKFKEVRQGCIPPDYKVVIEEFLLPVEEGERPLVGFKFKGFE